MNKYGQLEDIEIRALKQSEQKLDIICRATLQYMELAVLILRTKTALAHNGESLLS